MSKIKRTKFLFFKMFLMANCLIFTTSAQPLEVECLTINGSIQNKSGHNYNQTSLNIQQQVRFDEKCDWPVMTVHYFPACE